jgi:predicted membrane GTPase involved in stress response
VYTSALLGFASYDPAHRGGDMNALFEAVVRHCPPPASTRKVRCSCRCPQLDYSSYVGAIGIGRIKRGTLRRNMPVAVVDRGGAVRQERVMQVLGFLGLDRIEIEEAAAGDIVAFAGIEHPDDLGYALRPRAAGATAAARGRRADHQHDLRGEQLALRGREGRSSPADRSANGSCARR